MTTISKFNFTGHELNVLTRLRRIYLRHVGKICIDTSTEEGKKFIHRFLSMPLEKYEFCLVKGADTWTEKFSEECWSHPKIGLGNTSPIFWLECLEGPNTVISITQKTQEGGEYAQFVTKKEGKAPIIEDFPSDHFEQIAKSLTTLNQLTQTDADEYTVEKHYSNLAWHLSRCCKSRLPMKFGSRDGNHVNLLMNLGVAEVRFIQEGKVIKIAFDGAKERAHNLNDLLDFFLDNSDLCDQEMGSEVPFILFTDCTKGLKDFETFVAEKGMLVVNSAD